MLSGCAHCLYGPPPPPFTPSFHRISIHSFLVYSLPLFHTMATPVCTLCRRLPVMQTARLYSPLRRRLSTLSPPLAPPSPSPAPASTSPSPPPVRRRTNLLNLTSARLTEHLRRLDLPAFRAQQIFHHLYRQGLSSISAFTSLSAAHRHRLESHFTIDSGHLLEQRLSSDGTRKLLIGLPSTDAIECVYIPMRDRSPHTPGSSGAVCVSSQVACSLRCAFCATGAIDKSRVRNLQAAEIVGQVVHSLRATGNYTAALHTQPQPGPGDTVSSLVFMGMGEPGYNINNVLTALSILSDPTGLAFGRKRITVSTSGVVPAIDKLKTMNVKLAVSLHAVTNELRDRLVPVNRTWRLHELMQACRRYQMGEDGEKKSGQITFEYVMLKGVNDSVAEAKELTRLLRQYRIEGLVNLIPFNPVSRHCRGPHGEG